MPETTKKVHPFMTLSGALGAMGGYAVTQYCREYAWLPLAAMIGLMILFAKTPLGPKHFKLAIGATVTHILWFATAALLLGAWSKVFLDIAVLSICVVFLWVLPGLTTALFLGVLECAGLGYNVYQISKFAFGSDEHRALVVHCVLRIIAIIGVVEGYLRYRREKTAPPAPPAMPEGAGL